MSRCAGDRAGRGAGARNLGPAPAPPGNGRL